MHPITHPSSTRASVVCISQPTAVRSDSVNGEIFPGIDSRGKQSATFTLGRVTIHHLTSPRICLYFSVHPVQLHPAASIILRTRAPMNDFSLYCWMDLTTRSTEPLKCVILVGREKSSVMLCSMFFLGESQSSDLEMTKLMISI